MAWRQLADAAQRRAITRDVLQCQVRVDRLEVDLALHLGEPEQGLQLRGEGQRPVGEAGPEQRLLPEAVAREHESLAACIPEGEREHPVQPVRELRPALFVQVR